jgi:hypothetical protein
MKWYNNVFKPYYHIQITINYKKMLISYKMEKTIIETMMKSTTVKNIIEEVLEIRNVLWGGESETD